MKLNSIATFRDDVSGFFFLSKMCSPRRADQRTSTNYENPKMFGSYRLHNVFNSFHMKFDAKSTPDAFEHVPDHFWMAFRLKWQENQDT